MKFSRVFIEGIAYQLAPIVVSSSELEERLQPVYRRLRVEPGQLEAMTGISERRFWEPGFPVSRGAADAAQLLLRNGPVPPSAVEVLIYAGVCRQDFEPATACHVAAHLEQVHLDISPQAHVFDVSNACLGVLNAMLEIANRIELGQIRAGLITSCESAREIVDVTVDRLLREGSMDLFKTSLATLTGGSGAVAVLMSDGSFSGGQRRRLLGGVARAEPRHHMLCRWGLDAATSQPFMSTDPVAVREHGVALGVATWADLLSELEWSGSEVDRTICHQVGAGHRNAILQALQIPPEKDFVAYEFLGNTGTVALPLAAALAEERGFLAPGHRAALLGIGSGLNCLMLGVEW